MNVLSQNCVTHIAQRFDTMLKEYMDDLGNFLDHGGFWNPCPIPSYYYKVTEILQSTQHSLTISTCEIRY